jgi:hypothetical protein
MENLAKQFVSRANSMGMKGRARDRAALEFYLGAAAISVGNLQQQLLFSASMISVRGYAFVLEMAKVAPEENPAAKRRRLNKVRQAEVAAS